MSFLTRLFRTIHLLRHPQTPLTAKLLPLFALLYLFWPLDAIPDFIPLLGQLDDIGVIALLISLAWHFIPDHLKHDVTSTRRSPKDNVIDIEPKQ